MKIRIPYNRTSTCIDKGTGVFVKSVAKEDSYFRAWLAEDYTGQDMVSIRPDPALKKELIQVSYNRVDALGYYNDPTDVYREDPYGYYGGQFLGFRAIPAEDQPAVEWADYVQDEVALHESYAPDDTDNG